MRLRQKKAPPLIGCVQVRPRANVALLLLSENKWIARLRGGAGGCLMMSQIHKSG